MSHELAEPAVPMIPLTHAPSLQPPPGGRPAATHEVSREAPRSSRRQPSWAAWEWLRANTFAPSWLPTRWRHPAAGYAAAPLLLTLVMVIVHLFPGPHPPHPLAGSLALLVVALVALNWGAGPSLFAVLVELALRTTVGVPRTGAGEPVVMENMLETVLCLAGAIGISLAAGSTERSRRQAVEERTEAQARELAMRDLQARMDEFLAIASHDLRTPLTATACSIDLGVRQYERLTAGLHAMPPDLTPQITAVHARLDDASRSVDRLCRLVELLFDTAQARASTLALHRTSCDLAALVRDQVTALRLAHPHRTLYLEMPGEGSVPVAADADRIGQVVTNYVTNAVKYSPVDRPVTVQVARAGGWARVSVVDQGPGLPARERERIWQRFYHAEGIGVQSGSSTGLGLGLHICKTIVEGHGGQVGVDSAVGKGSTFWCVLPLDGTDA
jgi:signal transduction histidine kinase